LSAPLLPVPANLATLNLKTVFLKPLIPRAATAGGLLTLEPVLTSMLPLLKPNALIIAIYASNVFIIMAAALTDILVTTHFASITALLTSPKLKREL